MSYDNDKQTRLVLWNVGIVKERIKLPKIQSWEELTKNYDIEGMNIFDVHTNIIYLQLTPKGNWVKSLLWVLREPMPALLIW